MEKIISRCAVKVCLKVWKPGRLDESRTTGRGKFLYGNFRLFGRSRKGNLDCGVAQCLLVFSLRHLYIG